MKNIWVERWWAKQAKLTLGLISCFNECVVRVEKDAYAPSFTQKSLNLYSQDPGYCKWIGSISKAGPMGFGTYSTVNAHGALSVWLGDVCEEVWALDEVRVLGVSCSYSTNGIVTEGAAHFTCKDVDRIKSKYFKFQ